MKPDLKMICEHEKVTPKFDKEIADKENLTYAEVRRKWPRFNGVCPDCGADGVFYASTAHYLYGDW